MLYWAGALLLVVAALLAWGRLSLRFRLQLPQSRRVVVTLGVLGLTVRRELAPARGVAALLAEGLPDPGAVAAGLGGTLHRFREVAGFVRSNLDLLRYLLGGIRVTGLDLRARVGTGDAAATGLLLGWCWAAIGLVSPWIGARPRLRLEPEFERAVVEVDLTGTVVIRLARLLSFGLRLGWRLTPLVLRRIAGPRASNISQESRQGGVGL